MTSDKKILILGDGLLGSEIVKQTRWDYISRKKDGFSINAQLQKYLNSYDTIINCIGYTNTRDNSPDEHVKVNINFVKKLIKYCNEMNKKIVHISTDYVYTYSNKFATEDDALGSTNNWYGYSKLIGDAFVRFYANDFLLIRTTFKPNPYPYEYAWSDLYGNFDYVDIISKLIIKLINGNAKGVYNVGTEYKSLYELALRTNPNVKIDIVKNSTDRPFDTSMNLNKLNNFLKHYQEI